MGDEPIEREILRGAMFESLRRETPSQYLTFQNNVARLLAERELPVDGGTQGSDPTLRRIDYRRFREILWQLINQGVLVQGIDASNEQWPWLSLTEWGEEYVRAGGPDVYDPDGYLRDLASDRSLDDVEERYLSQASAAFRADLPDAAAVMAGSVSEHLLLLLADAIIASDQTASASKVKRARDGPALKLLNEISKYIQPRRVKLARPLSESFETTFLGVASVIRSSRNPRRAPGARSR